MLPSYEAAKTGLNGNAPKIKPRASIAPEGDQPNLLRSEKRPFQRRGLAIGIISAQRRTEIVRLLLPSDNDGVPTYAVVEGP
jgi:hypothetical protein